MNRSIDLSGSLGEQVAALELQAAARLAGLAALKAQLQALQDRYLEEIGPLYAELIPLDAAVAEAEIKAGLRVPDDEADVDVRNSTFELSGCGPASEPSVDLKRMFRDVAKAVHPDLSPHQDIDERTRFRRHSLMAEANRAYAERDEDRLRLIMRAWALEADALMDDDPDAERARRQRRAAALSAQIVEIDREVAELQRSAIGRLQRKIDDAKAQGWDLFGEMLRQTRREIATARAKLARLARKSPPAS